MGLACQSLQTLNGLIGSVQRALECLHARLYFDELEILALNGVLVAGHAGSQRGDFNVAVGDGFACLLHICMYMINGEKVRQREIYMVLDIPDKISIEEKKKKEKKKARPARPEKEKKGKEVREKKERRKKKCKTWTDPLTSTNCNAAAVRFLSVSSSSMACSCRARSEAASTCEDTLLAGGMNVLVAVALLVDAARTSGVRSDVPSAVTMGVEVAGYRGAAAVALVAAVVVVVAAVSRGEGIPPVLRLCRGGGDESCGSA